MTSKIFAQLECRRNGTRFRSSRIAPRLRLRSVIFQAMAKVFPFHWDWIRDRQRANTHTHRLMVRRFAQRDDGNSSSRISLFSCESGFRLQYHDNFNSILIGTWAAEPFCSALWFFWCCEKGFIDFVDAIHFDVRRKEAERSETQEPMEEAGEREIEWMKRFGCNWNTRTA